MTMAALKPGNARTQPKILIGATDDLEREIKSLSKCADDILMAAEIIQHRVQEVCETEEPEVVRWHVEYLTWQICSHIDDVNKRLAGIRELMPAEAAS